MSQDKGDAAFYDEHKDDPEIWGEPEASPPAPARRNLAVSVTVRFTADESDMVRRLARESGIPYSEVVRRAVRAFAQPPPAPRPNQDSSGRFAGSGARGGAAGR